MKAAYVEEPYVAGVRDIEIPEINENEVLIKVAYAGICGSDLHIYRGKHAYRVPPVILGHELSGTVEKIGDKVTGFKVGDRVAVMPQVSCGNCVPCLKGNENNCRHRMAPGTTRWQGAFTEYFPADVSTMVKIPDHLSLEWAALAEPLAVAVHSSQKISPENRKKVVIQGSGAIGLLITAIAPIMGIEQVITTDTLEYNLRKAEELGAVRGVNVLKEDLLEIVKEIYGEELATGTILGAAAPNIFEHAISVTAENGDVVILAMMANEMKFVPYSMSCKELSFHGTHTYTMEDFKKSVEILSSGEVDFSKIITQHFPVDEIQTAMEVADKKTQDSVKILIDF